MSQPAGLGIPLSSNNRANINTPLGGSGTQIAGVQSLNGQAGNLAVVGDTSIGVTPIGSGQLQISTAGKPQNVGSMNCASFATPTSVSVGTTLSVGGQTNLSGLVVSNGATVTQSGSPVCILNSPGNGGVVFTNPITIPALTQASIGYTATSVLIGPASFTQYSMVICGTRFWWGTGSTGSGGSYTAITLTGAGGATPIMCQVSPLPNSTSDSYRWYGYTAALTSGTATVNIVNSVTQAGVLSAQFTYLVAAPGF